MKNREFNRLIGIIKQLRDPTKGCPWDLKQTHKSLTRYIIEETYEFVAAVDESDPKKMEEEIGDVLLQVLLHTQIGSETKAFDFESSCKVLADKLTYRHPHVFNNSDNKFDGIEPDQVKINWEQLKKQEKLKNNDQQTHEIDERFLIFPALSSANKIGEKSTKVNFDWQNHQQVAQQVEEEWDELKSELNASKKEYDSKKVQEELGDLMFSIVQLSRHLKMDPEETLRMANRKFVNRFKAMEDLIKKENKEFSDFSSKEMEHFWKKAKKITGHE